MRLAVALALSFALPARTADDPVLRAEALAPGVWHVAARTVGWEAGASELVANSGFVVGERCIAVIDTGGSAALGPALRAAVRRVSPLPVCYVIHTHAHPDHVLGTGAFAAGERPAAIVAHERFAAAWSARAPHWLKRSPEVAAALPAPAITVQSTRELDLGGRVLELRAWPPAHTDSDVTVLDRTSGTLWLGDLVFAGHLPVLDGRLAGWRAVLAELRGWRVERAVPGHGAVMRDWPAGLASTADYLARLEADVRGALRSGATLAQTVERLGATDALQRAGWSLADAFHRRNVTAAYAELEWTE